MRRTKRSTAPCVEVMEPLLLLSTTVPRLTKQELAGIVREVKSIVSTLAQTGDTVQASAELNQVASQVPTGSAALARKWQSDLALFHFHSPKSVAMTRSRLIADLHRSVRGGSGGSGTGTSGTGNNSPTYGSGGSTYTVPSTRGTSSPTPTPTPSPTPVQALDSVTIENTTGLAIMVTVHLDVSSTYQPSIAEILPAQGDSIADFNFGTATNAFMTMDVRLAYGGQTPPAFSGLNLVQPFDGYSGTLYTISLFGPYFSVSIP